MLNVVYGFKMLNKGGTSDQQTSTSTCVCALHSVWNSISLLEAEHANRHHSLLTLPSANLAANSKVAHRCLHHLSLCNNIVLREYSNMLKQYNMLQQYKHCYNMLQHLQVCSIAALQNWCKNFNHLVHASSGLSGREQALWAKQMHVMADWGVMRPISCVTSVPSPSHLIKICMPDRNSYLAKSRCCQIILSAARLLCQIKALNFYFEFQSNLISAHLFWNFARTAAAESCCVLNLLK